MSDLNINANIKKILGNQEDNGRRGQGYNNPNGGQGNNGLNGGGDGGAPNNPNGPNHNWQNGGNGYADWKLKEFLRKVRDLTLLVAVVAAYAVASGEGDERFMRILRDTLF